ncbi:MAG: PQQ-binding-like beta-propeller repeat protein [Planctomycetes bacterium]|nr:PQQ-binding-like beta-propeller repeat protein [Planctomycetota bacterium]MBL7040894.1 PQQ-binding-like beta-propeller repeat protein [Pirellulaceae bacterium]
MRKHERKSPASLLSTGIVLTAMVSVLLSGAFTAPAAWAVAPTAEQILEATGVQGGLVVHVGCGDGQLTAALGARDGYLVHGLDADAANVEQARAHLQSRGIYGKVSVDRLPDNRLPYVDNLVNLLVVSGPSSIEKEEILRVLCPGGVAVELDPETRNLKPETLFRKPRPDEIDEWTHYLYDPTNNAVSKDETIAPLRRMQWIGSPRWSRHHDHMSSLSSLVAANGRLFYIFDEGSTASIVLPSRWFLIARDAFNGTILWKQPIERWHTQLWPLKSGPALLTRRLVAVGDEVYVTMGLDAPLCALDAATGKTLRTYKGTEGTDEVLVSEGTLFLVVNKTPEKTWQSYSAIADVKRGVQGAQWSGDEKIVMAVSADSGDILWQKKSFVAPSTLAADDQRVYFHDGQKVVSLTRQSGEQAWTSGPLPIWQKIQSWYVPALVIYKDVVLWSGGEKMIPHRGGQDVMTALSAETGKTLWSAPHAASGYQSAEDLLVAGGLVWTGATTSGGYDGIFSGHDPHTGEVKKQFPPDVESYWFHHRCYRGKATEKYLLMSRTGIEFLDLDKQSWELHHWVRGACLTGITPANGMVYAPQHDCACYPEAKVLGFAAVAPDSKSLNAMRAAADDQRLERGTAFGAVSDQQSAVSENEWPTYRGNGARTGYTSMRVAAELKPAWETKLGGKLSSVTVADGKLFVASVDTHTMHALDAKTGDPAWSYTTGGRVDSPPTIWQGCCLFGSADGYVYCLRASDGALAWRFRAAPIDQRHTVFEQVESVWPVHGSVLVQDGSVCFVAGRSMFLDGGLHLFRLDPKTGRVLTHRHFDDKDPETGENLQVRHQTLQMPVALADILSSDGERLYMRSQVFDLEGNRQALGPNSGDLVLQATVQRGKEAHLFAPYGFLDGSWFHRSYWVYGRSFSGSHGGYYQAGKFAPAGRILTADDRNVYGYGRKPQYLRWTTPMEYHLFATSNDPPELPDIAGWRQGTSGSWISVEKSPSLNPTNTPLAVEAWVKADKPAGAIVANGGPSHGYALFLQQGRPHFAIRVKGDLFVVSAKQKVVGDWVHLAGVLTADKKLEVYVDGELAATGKAGGFIVEEPAQAIEVGADSGTEGVGEYRGTLPFTGLIDQVRAYYGTVSADEIQKHSQTPDDTTVADAKLVLDFTFEKGKARDLSGNNNHGKLGGVKPVEGKLGTAIEFTGRSASGGKNHFVQYHWSVENPPVVARAMVLADKTLFVAGPPDLVDEDEVVADLVNPELLEKLAAQEAALAGKKGAILLAVSTTDGQTLAQQKLKFPPTWDGMAAANACLYLSTVDGKVMCLAGEQ